MKHVKLIVFFALSSSTLVSMQQRYSKRKQSEQECSSIVSDRRTLKTAFLSSYISRHGDKKLKRYTEKIQKFMYELDDYDTIHDKDIKQKVSHHLKECGLEHKKAFLVHDISDGLQYPGCADLDDIVILELNIEQNQNALDFGILHELGHLIEKDPEKVFNTKKEKHEREFKADRFAQNYFLERKIYLPIIYDALYYLQKNPKYLLKDSASHPCPLARAKKQLDSLQAHAVLENKTIADILLEEESLNSLDRILIKKTINQYFPSRYFH
jgi:hypothetical protein